MPFDGRTALESLRDFERVSKRRHNPEISAIAYMNLIGNGDIIIQTESAQISYNTASNQRKPEISFSGFERIDARLLNLLGSRTKRGLVTG